MKNGRYESSTVSAGRMVLRIGGAVLLSLLAVNAVASAVMAKTVALTVPNDPFDSKPSGVKLIKGLGNVSDFPSGGTYPAGVMFGDGMILVTHTGEHSVNGIDEATGTEVLNDDQYGWTVNGLALDSATGVYAVDDYGDPDYDQDGILYFHFPNGEKQVLNLGPEFGANDMKFVDGDLCVASKNGLYRFSETQPGQFAQVALNEGVPSPFMFSLDYNPSMNALVAGNSVSNEVRFYDFDTLQEIPGSSVVGLLNTLNSSFAVNPLDHTQLWGADGLNVNIVDIPSKQVVNIVPITGSGTIKAVQFSPDGTELSVIVRDTQPQPSRIVIFRISPNTGEVINQANPEVYYTDSDMLPLAIDVANDDVQPPQDSDQDGLTDDVDGCPNSYNPAQTDKDNNGTQDACQEGALDGYSEVFELGQGSHLHTDGNVIVDTQTNQVSMGEAGKLNVVHSGAENIQVTAGAWINFDIEVFEGSVEVPTQDGIVTVGQGEKVDFGGNPNGVLIGLSGTDFVVQTYDYAPPIEPEPEPNPEYAEPKPDVVEGNPEPYVEPFAPEGVGEPYGPEVVEEPHQAEVVEQTPDTPGVDEVLGDTPSGEDWSGNVEALATTPFHAPASSRCTRLEEL